MLLQLFRFQRFRAYFCVYSVFGTAEGARMPCLWAFQGAGRYTERTVSASVSPAPFCKQPETAIPRVKICKRHFHILYTNIQITILYTNRDLYICIYRNRAQMPINKGFFTFRKCQYTDIHFFCHFKRGGKRGKWGRRYKKKMTGASLRRSSTIHFKTQTKGKKLIL